MTERNKADNGEVVSVKDRLIRMGLKPRTQEELNNIIFEDKEKVLSEVCEHCGINKKYDDVEKPEGTSIFHNKFICPECGDVSYSISSCDQSIHRLIAKKMKQQMGWEGNGLD